MPQIDFYNLSNTDLQAAYQYICRVIEKVYQRGHKVYVHASSLQEAHQIDEMLWTFKESSFIPHNMLGEGPDQAPPVQLGFNETPASHRDVLINLSSEVPDFYSQFKRILEVVPNIEETKQAANKRLSYYQEKNYQTNNHEIKSS